MRVGGPTESISVQQNYNQEADSSSVNLSHAGNLTATAGRYLKAERYLNGEVKVVFIYRGGNQVPPDPRQGPVKQEKLTDQAKSKIKRVARMMAYGSAKQSFITLTYGKNWPSDKDAKAHIDRFLKRIRRRYANLAYVWVAERQKRGAIHFHILTPSYIPWAQLHKHWNGVVQKWQRSKGYDLQEVEPNVKGVKDAGKYMAKYMSKSGCTLNGNLYGMSQSARDLMKPVGTYCVRLHDNGEGELDAVQKEVQEKQGIESLRIEKEEVNEDTGETWLTLFGLFFPAGNLCFEDLLTTLIKYSDST